MLALSLIFLQSSASWLTLGWSGLLVLLFLYPWFGLALEKAPGWAYRALLIGPVFMVWRGWINLMARLRAKKIVWVRTPHRS